MELFISNRGKLLGWKL